MPWRAAAILPHENGDVSHVQRWHTHAGDVRDRWASLPIDDPDSEVEGTQRPTPTTKRLTLVADLRHYLDDDGSLPDLHPRARAPRRHGARPFERSHDMRPHPRPSIASLALLLVGLSLPAMGQAQQAEEPLPLTPIGGIPIEVVITVAFDVREAIAGDELYAYEGGWTHTQEGRLLRDAGWLAHRDRIDDARGAGRDVCWYDWGQPAGTPHWTVQWSGEIALPAPMRRASPASFPLPPIHIAIDGTEALVIYAPPREFTYGYPGSPDDCQNPDPVPASDRTAFVVFDLDEVDVARPPGAAHASDVVIQDGIVLLRLPLARLSAGTTDIAAVNLSGTQGDVAWGLRIGLTLTSSPGKP